MTIEFDTEDDFPDIDVVGLDKADEAFAFFEDPSPTKNVDTVRVKLEKVPN